MRHLAALLFGLVMLWLVLSGHYAPLTLALGGVSCALVAWLCARLGLVNAQGVPIVLLPRLPFYTLWLLAEIAKANIGVAWRLLAPTGALQPAVVRLSTAQASDFGRAVFANSVTLTPGTVTIGLENDQAIIHALSPLASDDTSLARMQQRVRWLDGKQRG